MAIYKLLPRKRLGWWTITLVTDETRIQFRSLQKALCVDWLAENQPEQAS